MLRSQRWRAEWRWPQNVSWCCISYCLLSLFHALVCMIVLKALCIFELCFLSIVISYRISWAGEEIKKAKKASWLFLLKGWKLIMAKQAEPWPPTPFIWGAMRLIIPLERLQVRAPQPALSNSHGNETRRTQRWRRMAHYGLLLLSYSLVSQRAGRRWERKRWEEATTVSHYELGWLMVVMRSV